MKKLLTLLLLGTLSLTSCSKDSSSNVSTEETVRAITLSDLQGEWRLNGGLTLDGAYYDVYLVVDGNVLWLDVDDANGNQAAPSQQFSISVSNGIITTTIPDAQGATILLVGRTLTITLADGTVEVYTRQ